MKSSTKNPRGLVITYFGDGKGKTTAALGLALRASGYDKKITIIQFIKGDWISGEEISLKKFKNAKLIKTGLGFIGIKNDKKSLTEHREAAIKGLELVKREIKNCDILILDEVMGAIKGKLINEKDVLDLINKKPTDTTLVLTGSPKIGKIIDNSDLVTQMCKIKHPYDKGIDAIHGVDY